MPIKFGYLAKSTAGNSGLRFACVRTFSQVFSSRPTRPRDGRATMEGRPMAPEETDDRRPADAAAAENA